jgi:hypothetical protein
MQCAEFSAQDELGEFIEKFRRHYANYTSLWPWFDGFIQYVVNRVDRHLGMLRWLLVETVNHVAKIECNDLVKVVQNWWLDSVSEGKSGFWQRFGFIAALPDECAAIIRDMFRRIAVAGIDVAPAPGDCRADAVKLLVKMNAVIEVVQSDGSVVLGFMNSLQKQYVLKLLFPNKAADYNHDFNGWLKSVIATFEPNFLHEHRHALKNSTVCKESPLQHQFWRGASLHLPIGARLAAEMSSTEDVRITGTCASCCVSDSLMCIW